MDTYIHNLTGDILEGATSVKGKNPDPFYVLTEKENGCTSEWNERWVKKYLLIDPNWVLQDSFVKLVKSAEKWYDAFKTPEIGTRPGIIKIMAQFADDEIKKLGHSVGSNEMIKKYIQSLKLPKRGDWKDSFEKRFDNLRQDQKETMVFETCRGGYESAWKDCLKKVIDALHYGKLNPENWAKEGDQLENVQPAADKNQFTYTGQEMIDFANYCLEDHFKTGRVSPLALFASFKRNRPGNDNGSNESPYPELIGTYALECIDPLNDYTVGKIYPIQKIEEGSVFIVNDNNKLDGFAIIEKIISSDTRLPSYTKWFRSVKRGGDEPSADEKIQQMADQIAKKF